MNPNAGGAPIDPLFYVDLDAMGQRNGFRAEDALYIWTSESNLNPTLDGASRTISTLMYGTAVPVIGVDAWNKLPSLSHREQLPYIEQVVWVPAHRSIGGRSFRSTFEVYLANAASALLRPDGIYDDKTPMYIGGNYPDNWTMERTDLNDNQTTAAVDAYRAWVNAQPKGVNTSLRAAYPVAQALISQGKIKGYVSLGDLRWFGKRLGTSSNTLNTAITYLNGVRASVAANEAPNIHGPLTGSFAWQPASTTTPTYTPDFDSQFAAPGTAPDTRVATPSAARAATPKTAKTAGSMATPQTMTSQFLKVGIITGVGLGVLTAIVHGRR